MAIKTILSPKGGTIENNNELKRIQGFLLHQMERLDDEELIKTYSKREIARAGALSQQASAYAKAVANQIRILELSGKYNVEPDDMNEYLGIKVVEPTKIAKSKLEQQLDKFNAERQD